MDPITCIQIASQVSSMLSPKGPDISNLMAIQTRMLKNISNQITKVQEGIGTLILDVQNLKNYVQYSQPSDIYKKFVTEQLLANFRGYDEDILAYLTDRNNDGIYYSLELNKQNLYNRLQQIKNKRQEILGHKDFFLAPILARCFKIEIDLMILLYGESVSYGTFIACFDAYENWFQVMQNVKNENSLDYAINELKKRIDIENAKLFGFRMCKVSATEKVIEDDPFLKMNTYLYNHNIHVEYFSFQKIIDPKVEQKIIEEGLEIDYIENTYKELGLELYYMPLLVSQSIESKISEEDITITFRDEIYIGKFKDPAEPTRFIDSYDNDKFDVTRKDIEHLNLCDTPDPIIKTNKKFFSAAENFNLMGKQMIVLVSQKKILYDLQNKINELKKLI